MVLNPVRAGVVEKPEAWRWSSYQATAGLQKEPDYLATDWILGLFNRKRTVAQGHYRNFVREGVSAGTPWGKVQGQVLLGGEGFAEKFKSLLEYKREVKEIPRSQRYVSRPSLDEIFSGQETKGERDVRINTAHISHGYTLKDIADYQEIHYTTVSRVIGKAVINKK